MTRVIELLARVHVTPIGLLVAASALSLVFGAIGIWSLLRVRRLMAFMPPMQERLNTVVNSLTLLTDTTEACFKTLSMQLQVVQAQQGPKTARRAVAADEGRAEPAARKSRQRRIVGAARRGEAVAAIAAREELAEGEVALRLKLNGESLREAAREPKRYGSILS